VSQRFFVSNMRIYFSAQNLFTVTGYSGQDPTVSTMSNARTPGYDYSAYPVPRTFIFGAQISF
jgi:outer membrane receptor protein involved in Fe transport